ncbi:MAG: efflux RND transporter periplasmic adaptor subunit [Burkholderiales bacterium]|nr:efflux RND transporter periplasmic adaptor subunit [Burkholderiales bacterium]
MGLLSVKRLLFLGIILAGIAAGLYYRNESATQANEAIASAEGGPLSGKGGKGGKAQKGQKGPATVPVTAARVEARSVPYRIEAIGNVEAYASVQIKPRVDGQIVEINFKEGQEVKQGGVLIRLDPRPFEAALHQAEAALARDRATQERAGAQEARYKELLEKSFVSADGYLQFRTNAQTAQAVAKASEAAVENAKLQLDYTTIRSPIDGYVGKILLQRGNIARFADPNPIVVVNQVHPIYVSFAVPEQRLAEIRARMKTGLLEVDAVPSDSKGRAVSGKLVFVDNAVDLATGTIRLKAQFENRDNTLWPGQFAQVSLRLFDERDALVVPARAVQTGPNGQFAFVIKDDSTVEVRPITIARTESEMSIVSAGLHRDEQVVTQGQLRLGPGTRVVVRAQ